jgi:hypothetical protein
MMLRDSTLEFLTPSVNTPLLILGLDIPFITYKCGLFLSFRLAFLDLLIMHNFFFFFSKQTHRLWVFIHWEEGYMFFLSIYKKVMRLFIYEQDGYGVALKPLHCKLCVNKQAIGVCWLLWIVEAWLFTMILHALVAYRVHNHSHFMVGLLGRYPCEKYKKVGKYVGE